MFITEQVLKGPSFYLSHDYYPNRTHYDVHVSVTVMVTRRHPYILYTHTHTVSTQPKLETLCPNAKLNNMYTTTHSYGFVNHVILL